MLLITSTLYPKPDQRELTTWQHVELVACNFVHSTPTCKVTLAGARGAIRGRHGNNSGADAPLRTFNYAYSQLTKLNDD